MVGSSGLYPLASIATTLFRCPCIARVRIPVIPTKRYQRLLVGFKTNLNSRMASTSNSSHHQLQTPTSVPSEQDSNTMPPSFVVTETYAPQDPFQLYRLATATPFHCSRCKREKKAKLVATRDGRWDTLLCNGCYGLNLSKRQ